jgi:hypothetical protein
VAVAHVRSDTLIGDPYTTLLDSTSLEALRGAPGDLPEAAGSPPLGAPGHGRSSRLSGSRAPSPCPPPNRHAAASSPRGRPPISSPGILHEALDILLVKSQPKVEDLGVIAVVVAYGHPALGSHIRAPPSQVVDQVWPKTRRRLASKGVSADIGSYTSSTFSLENQRKQESRRADSNRWPHLLTSDNSGVAGVCTSLQNPHI